MGIPDPTPSGPKGPLPWDKVVLTLHNLFEIFLVEINEQCEERCNREAAKKINQLDKEIDDLEEMIRRYPHLEPILRPVIDDLKRQKDEAKDEKDKCLGNCREKAISSDEVLAELGVSLVIPAK